MSVEQASAEHFTTPQTREAGMSWRTRGILALTGVVTLGTIAGGGYWLYHGNQTRQQETNEQFVKGFALRGFTGVDVVKGHLATVTIAPNCTVPLRIAGDQVQPSLIIGKAEDANGHTLYPDITIDTPEQEATMIQQTLATDYCKDQQAKAQKAKN